MRAEMAEAVGGLIGQYRPEPTLSYEEEIETHSRAADIVTFARTGVELDYRGDVIEPRPRDADPFAKQLDAMFRGGRWRSAWPGNACALALRCARDSIPRSGWPSAGPAWTSTRTSPSIDIRRRVERPRATVDRLLQALHILGLLTCEETEEQRMGRNVQVRLLQGSRHTSIWTFPRYQICQ